jgi:hypothetical protein
MSRHAALFLIGISSILSGCSAKTPDYPEHELPVIPPARTAAELNEATEPIVKDQDSAATKAK